jgi:hypothetical protein
MAKYNVTLWMPQVTEEVEADSQEEAINSMADSWECKVLRDTGEDYYITAHETEDE